MTPFASVDCAHSSVHVNTLCERLDSLIHGLVSPTFLAAWPLALSGLPPRSLRHQERPAQPPI